jgi:HD-GYP domain-containing protein (c-di-GMP phosphodiesterase class II)
MKDHIADFDEVGELEEMEELTEIEDLNDGPDENTSDGPISKILHDPYIQIWTDNFNTSDIPCLVVDQKLNIVWENNKHKSVYTDDQSSHLKSFPARYYKELGEEKISDLYKYTQTSEYGYTWKGRINHRRQEQSTIIINVQISPFFSVDYPGQPFAYSVFFDDITKETKSQLRSTFLSLLEASKLKDNDTGNHIERVNRYSERLSEELFFNTEYQEIDRDFIDHIAFLAAMHDVGKIGTPDDVLNKAGPLEDWEWDVMKEHTKNGAYILSTYPNPMARQIALFHHEWWDGSGYPYKIANNMIPLAARIVSLADVYDALRSKRSYKEAFSHNKSYELMVKDSGKHFDPDLINVFSRIHFEFDTIYIELAD